LAQALIKGSAGDLSATDPGTAVRRSWSAITAKTKIKCP
jgi:hypothetical protein